MVKLLSICLSVRIVISQLVTHVYTALYLRGKHSTRRAADSIRNIAQLMLLILLTATSTSFRRVTVAVLALNINLGSFTTPSQAAATTTASLTNHRLQNLPASRGLNQWNNEACQWLKKKHRNFSRKFCFLILWL